MNKSNTKSFLFLAVAMGVCTVRSAPVAAYDGEYTAATGYVTMKYSDGSATSSWDTVGYWSDGNPPYPGTNYYVGSSRTLNVRKNGGSQSSAPFAGGKLVVAGRLYDYGLRNWNTTLGDSITMLPGSEYFMSSAGNVTNGLMRIEATAENPTLMTFSNTADYTKKFNVQFAGDNDACVEFRALRGGTPTYDIDSFDSMPDFSGRIRLGSNVVMRSATTLSVPGDVDITGEDGALVLKGTSGTSVLGGFSSVAGAGLYLSGTGNTQVLHVTNRLSLASGSIVKTDKFRTWDYGTPPTYPVIRMSAEAVAAGVPDVDSIDVQAYSMGGRLAAGVIPQLRMVTKDFEQGEKSLDVSYYEVVRLTNNTSYAATPFLDRTSSDWSERNDPARFWSDGQDPSPEKDYYVTDSYGVIFRASSFAGHSLVIKGGVYFGIYGGVQTMPLVASGGGRIRLMRGHGHEYVLDGTIRVEGTQEAYDLMFGAGNASRLTVNSELSGSANVALVLNPELTAPENYAGTIEFAGDNSAFKGRIQVLSGSRGDFSKYFEDKGYATWEPSAVSNVTFEVSDNTNLGGALPEFVFNALEVSDESRLVLKETATFDETSRGWLFAAKAYLQVPAGRNATVENTITYGTELVKEGAGTLTLASKPRFLVDGASVETSNGAKLTVSEGLLGVTSPDALAGLAVGFASGTGLVVPIEGTGSGLGVDLTGGAIEAPQGLPIYLDTTSLPERPESGVVTAVCTLPEDSPALSALRIGRKPYDGTATKLKLQANGDGTVTVSAVTERVGLVMVVR